MDDRTTRRADLETLARDYKNAGADDRRRIKQAAYKIQHESKAVRDMREALIKAHRRGDREEIKDIHYIVSKNMGKYGNGWPNKIGNDIILSG